MSGDAAAAAVVALVLSFRTVAMFAAGWGADGTNAIFGEDGSGVERDALLLLLLVVVVRLAVLRDAAAAAVVALVLAFRAVAHFAASCLVAYRADAVIWNNGLSIQGLKRLFAFVAVAVFRPAGLVGTVAAMTSLRVLTVITAWSLGPAKVDAADAVVGHDCLGVCHTIAVLDVFVGSSGS